MLVSLLAAILLSVSPARGEGADISGSLEVQARAFWHDPQWVGQDDQALQGTLISTTEKRIKRDRRILLFISVKNMKNYLAC